MSIFFFVNQKWEDNSPTGDGRVTVLAHNTPFTIGGVYVQLYEYRSMLQKLERKQKA